MQWQRLHIRVLLAAFLVVLPLSVPAAVISPDWDVNGAAQVEAGYLVLEILEGQNNNNLKDIFESYKDAEIAMASVYSFKLAERSAKKGVPGLFTSSESWYYRHIWYLVEQRIIPLTISIVKECVKHPGKAMYWGPFMYERLYTVKELCKEFTSVVTNGKLGFDGIQWIDFVPEVRQVFEMYKQAQGVKERLDKFADVVGSMTKEELWDDVKKLFSKVSDVATVGAGEVVETNGRKVFDKLINHTGDVRDFVVSFDDIYMELTSVSTYKNLFNNIVGDLQDSLAWTHLLQLDNGYNIGNYFTDYLRSVNNEYYTVQCVVRAEDYSGDVVTVADILYDTFDSRLNTLEVFKNDMIARAKDKVMEENIDYQHKTNNTDHYLDGSYYEFMGGRYGNFYFKVLDETKQYYSVPDEAFVSGASAASLYLQCDNGHESTSGAFEFKINEYLYIEDDNASNELYIQKDVYGSNNSHCYKEPRTTIVERPDQSASEDKIAENNAKIATLNNQIAGYEQMIRNLWIQKTYITDPEAVEQIDYNIYLYTTYRDEKQAERDSIQAENQDIENAMQAQEDDYYDNLDGDYRIYSAMLDMERYYKVEWLDGGTWNGPDFQRSCTMPDLPGVSLLFKAHCSVPRNESYNWLVGRYHRLIARVEWKLVSDQRSDDLVQVIRFDRDISDQERRRRAEEARSVLQQNNPGCNVYIVYEEPKTVQPDTEEEAVHLLWPADRLAFARYVDQKIEYISHQLVLFEKWVYEDADITDYFKKVFQGWAERPLHAGIAGLRLGIWRGEAKGHMESLKHVSGTRRKEAGL